VRKWFRRLPVGDPGLAALRGAARAAIVVPAVFAIADKGIGDPQLATFAAFGSFAMLVFVEFGGPVRTRLIAYLAVACAGTANIALGTLCSRSAWLAAVSMALVGFTILFSGVINGYFAAGGTATMLPFILAVTLPSPVSVVPARIEGWWLAAGAAIAAQLLLWPSQPRVSLRRDAAKACRALAELADARFAGDRKVVPDRQRVAREAVDSFRQRFLATPHRSAGPNSRDAALSSLVDELDWLLSFLEAPVVRPTLEVCPQENREAVDAAAATLRAVAARLVGGDEEPDLDRLDSTRYELARAIARRVPELPTVPDDERLMAALGPAFRIRVVSYGAREVARLALRAIGEQAPDTDEGPSRWQALTRPVRSGLEATEQLTVEHAGPRSVWFRNSVRGAVGLALAVYVAQRSGVQHAFWVVLGTLSVLRSNALGTGWSILSALGGTAVGIVVGAALVIGIGTHQAVAWAVLPVAVLLASYAQRAISFAAGQAAFTVTLFVLFDLIEPTGWRVGLVRIEDVAIGFAISLGVGILFWPRGAAALLRENLAYAYARNADFVVAAEHDLVAGPGPSTSVEAAQAASVAAHRLDEAFRQYLAERSASPGDRESIAGLVTGAARVRRAAESLSALARMAGGETRLARCGSNLDAEVHALRSWYVTLGDALVHATAVPPPHTRDFEGRGRLLECVREALADGDRTKLRPALFLLWASQHLDALWQFEEHLGTQAAATTARLA
jgi:uncharacterized membrane protein YccC